ncbi:MAG: hypothetical protein A3F68_13065 [Acidobacteria bacterium RIFCSPLOWO2_12_FULL_54_10]|nr:MAG: hypothetical protein A3F68_13065 [Acidobacteria bacterium RIFCSPLOWO2_12_FULL_54_10]
MKTMIQLEGFTVSHTSRTYNYRVIYAPGDSRLFAVHIPLESFRATPLKFQDGPLVTRERLELELGREIQGATTEANLNVTEPDILTYLDKHYPQKIRKNITWLPKSS